MGNKNSVKLKIEDINKVFYSDNQKFEAIEDISFDVYDNEFLVILGPGLCGKTVLLNMISGLLEPSNGKIFLDGEEIKSVNPSIGLVFQELALLPWKSVMENVEFGLKLKGVSKDERRKTAQYYINLVGLDGFENSYPHELSGGMKQRVGIARAYSINPSIILLDEPFGQLDAQTRYAMENEILTMWDKEKKTIVFVTNNIEEALYLGDRIILLEKAPAKVKDIYSIDLPRPRNQTSEEFLSLRQEISNNMDLDIEMAQED